MLKVASYLVVVKHDQSKKVDQEIEKNKARMKLLALQNIKQCLFNIQLCKI